MAGTSGTVQSLCSAGHCLLQLRSLAESYRADTSASGELLTRNC